MLPDSNVFSPSPRTDVGEAEPLGPHAHGHLGRHVGRAVAELHALLPAADVYKKIKKKLARKELKRYRNSGEY